MNKTKTASPRARRLKHRRNGANGARHNGEPPQARNPAPGADIRSTTSDLAERNGTRAFQRSESRYQALFDLGRVAIYSIDSSGVIQEFNRRAAELWGREPALGDTDERFCGSFKMFRPDGSFMSHERSPMAEVLSGKITAADDTEVVIERPDGSRVTVLVNIRPLKNDRGEIIGAINCFYDITERKKNERLLAEGSQQREALLQFVQRRSAAQSLEEIYSVALDCITDTLRCDRASILLFDEGGVMRFVAWRGLSDNYRKAVEGHSPWKQGAKNPESICVVNVDLAGLPKSLKTTILNEGIRAAAFIPLVAEGKLIGNFMTYYNKPHTLSGEEITVALNIAGQLALGIERKRAEGALRESEERLRALVEQSTAGMARTSLDGTLAFANERFCEMLGYKHSELIGRQIRELTHPHDQGKTRELFERLARKAIPYEVEKRYLRKDGKIIWVNVSAAPVLDRSGNPHSAVAVVVDVTARKRAETELQQSTKLLEKLVHRRTTALRVANAELENEITRRKGLEGQILEISDREQERLGQELHDGLCQQLTAIGFLARATALRLKDHRVVQTEDLERIAQLINSSVMDARNIARDLHKEEIDAAEFPMALRALVERKIWKTPCRLELKTEVSIEDDKVASQLYRILREAVINANKHARATQIILEVRRIKNEVVFSVTDNGVGLSKKPKAGQGLGFHIMQYRAHSIGACLEFESPKKGGSRVACYLPLSVIK
jgi:PAS domain S-box-containing protein